MNRLAFLLLRLGVGISMFCHGLVRLPKLVQFSNWMVSSMEASMLPRALVIPFSYVLPFVEFLVGLLLVIGLWTRQAALVGGFLMLSLIFGTSIAENWDALPSQLTHLAFFAVLVQFVGANGLAVDRYLRK